MYPREVIPVHAFQVSEQTIEPVETFFEMSGLINNLNPDNTFLTMNPKHRLFFPYLSLV